MTGTGLALVIDAVGLPAFDVFVDHQVDSGENKNAQRARPETFEERQRTAGLISLDHRVG